MSNNPDIAILELLASKICHDLISPIGAVNNGVELLEETEADPAAQKDIVGLIAFSAAQASAKLQAYRMAYGAGGADEALKPEDVYNIFQLLIELDGKVRQNWDPHVPLGPDVLPRGFCKILMSCMILLLDSLPKGGTVAITKTGANQITIRAAGEVALLREGTFDALSLAISPAALDPYTVHPYVTGLLAKEYGFAITVPHTGEDTLILEITVPAN